MGLGSGWSWHYISGIARAYIMRIVSIDPGTKNLGWAVWEDGKIIDFGSTDIISLVERKRRTDYPFITKTFIDESGLFANVDVVLIENQMQAKMKIIACSLRCFFFDKAVPISPLAVRNHFGISNSNYRLNKKASCKFVHKFLSEDQSRRVVASKKADDISDAVIQLYYYVEKNQPCV